jgi:AcrR family transcriptional regulator
VSSVRRARGRPATVTADGLARAALALWDDRGYDDVPLSEVAAAVGVTERTLFRYFASKSDIVWQSIDTSFADLHRHLAATPPGERLISRVRVGVLAAFDLGEDVGLTRMRLRIISRTPELYNNSSPPFTAWRTVIQDFVAQNIGDDPAGLIPHVAAASVQAATMSALIWWGSQNQGDAADAVDQALRRLESGFDH